MDDDGRSGTLAKMTKPAPNDVLLVRSHLAVGFPRPIGGRVGFCIAYLVDQSSSMNQCGHCDQFSIGYLCPGMITLLSTTVHTSYLSLASVAALV